MFPESPHLLHQEVDRSINREATEVISASKFHYLVEHNIVYNTHKQMQLNQSCPIGNYFLYPPTRLSPMLSRIMTAPACGSSHHKGCRDMPCSCQFHKYIYIYLHSVSVYSQYQLSIPVTNNNLLCLVNFALASSIVQLPTAALKTCLILFLTF